MRYNLRSLIKSQEGKIFFYFALGGVVQFIFGYVLTFITNTTLNSEEVGKFNYYYNLCNLLISILSFGLYASYIRIIGEGFDDALRKFVLIFYTIITLIYSVICFITGNAFLIPFIFLLFFNERQYYYRSRENIKLYLLGSVIKGITLVFSLALFYKLNGSLNYKNIIFSVGISYFFSSVIFLFSKDANYEKKFKNQSWFAFIKEIDFKKVNSIALPTMVTTISNWILRFSDQYIIKMFYTFEKLGPYSVATRMIVLIQVISGLFLLYYPKFYFKNIKLEQYSKIRFVRILFFSGIIILVFFLIIGRVPLYKIMGAGQYIQYSHFFVILIIGELFRILAGINFTYLSYIYKTKFVTYSLLSVSLINIILNYFFIEKGIIYAAYNSLISCLIYFILSLILSIKPERKASIK